jgi:hypothetical protein
MCSRSRAAAHRWRRFLTPAARHSRNTLQHTLRLSLCRSGFCGGSGLSFRFIVDAEVPIVQ